MTDTPHTEAMRVELTDMQYLQRLADHYKDSLVPEIRAHFERLNAIAARLTEQTDGVVRKAFCGDPDCHLRYSLHGHAQSKGAQS